MGMGSAPAAAAATVIPPFLPSSTTSLIMGTEYLAAAQQEAEFNSCSFDSHTTLFVKDDTTINY